MLKIYNPTSETVETRAHGSWKPREIRQLSEEDWDLAVHLNPAAKVLVLVKSPPPAATAPAKSTPSTPGHMEAVKATQKPKALAVDSQKHVAPKSPSLLSRVRRIRRKKGSKKR